VLLHSVKLVGQGILSGDWAAYFAADEMNWEITCSDNMPGFAGTRIVISIDSACYSFYAFACISDRVMSVIAHSATILSELDRMVEETAYHILRNGDMTTRHSATTPPT